MFKSSPCQKTVLRSVVSSTTTTSSTAYLLGSVGRKQGGVVLRRKSNHDEFLMLNNIKTCSGFNYHTNIQLMNDVMGGNTLSSVAADISTLYKKLRNLETTSMTIDTTVTNDSNIHRFKLSKAFVEKYKNIPPPFGFNGLGEVVYKRTYSRVIEEENRNEEWYETVERVVNGTYNMQRNWIEHHKLGWNPRKAQRSAQEMYDRIFNMKFLPSGRGLWGMGTPLTEQRGLYAALNNCAFVSTESMKEDPLKPFVFLMDMSMLGVGVGFDTKGAGSFGKLFFEIFITILLTQFI